jgi:trigger factor
MKKFLGIIGMLTILTACDRGAKQGDTVVIDFEGFLNGVQFEGGTAYGFPLKLGSGQFVPGFEEQLIGIKKDEERDVKIKFPDQYVPGLAGKEVVFKVKAVEIK